jgi:hypothetical protein
MTLSSLSSTQAPGPSRTGSRPTPKAAAARMRERTGAPPAAVEVHVWFAAPSPSSRYLDIVLAAQGPQPAQS